MGDVLIYTKKSLQLHEPLRRVKDVPVSATISGYEDWANLLR